MRKSNAGLELELPGPPQPPGPRRRAPQPARSQVAETLRKEANLRAQVEAARRHRLERLIAGASSPDDPAEDDALALARRFLATGLAAQFARYPEEGVPTAAAAATFRQANPSAPALAPDTTEADPARGLASPPSPSPALPPQLDDSEDEAAEPEDSQWVCGVGDFSDVFKKARV